MISINVLTNVGSTILSIVLFFVALGVLVTIHELGHFIAAKSFKVYCSDFSIGFGPKIIKIKRKKGETRFSVGLLPLGGYVSMLGDEDNDATLDDGQVIPQSRTLTGIARWKRIIIMAAGIVMNFILAYIIFFICASCFEQIQPFAYYDVNPTQVSQYLEDTDGKFGTNDQFIVGQFVYEQNNENSSWQRFDPSKHSNTAILNVLHKGYITNGVDETKYVATLSYSFARGLNNTDITRNIYLYETSEESKVGDFYLPLLKEGKVSEYQIKEGDEFIVPVEYANATSDTPILDLKDEVTYETNPDSTITKRYNAKLKLKVNEKGFDEVGISFHKINYWNGWNSFGKAGELWVNSTGLISEALGGLFIGQGWDQLGGPLAIFNQTTEVLENNPFNFYLQTWGVLSVNLALFNLLPFPGLDGWQICVEIVEGTVNFTKKSIYNAKKKKEKVNGKPLEEVNQETAVEINENQVTTNKDVNMTIGENTKDQYKEWQIPAKVKGIMSYIGLGLLFALMIFVFIKDIMGMF